MNPKIFDKSKIVTKTERLPSGTIATIDYLDGVIMNIREPTDEEHDDFLDNEAEEETRRSHGPVF